MPFVRDPVSWALLAIGVAGLVVSLYPQWSERVDPETGDHLTERRLGLWDSPLGHYVWRVKAQGGGFNSQAGVSLFSWSFLLFVVGVVSLQALRERRAAGRPGQKADPPAA